MTARFIRVQGQARFTRKWPFETRVIRQKGVTYCRRRRVPRAIFLSAFIAFLPSPPSSYHHGSVLLIHREIRAKVRACSLSESRKSRSFNASNANKNCGRTIFPQAEHTLLNYRSYIFFILCTLHFSWHVHILNFRQNERETQDLFPIFLKHPTLLFFSFLKKAYISIIAYIEVLLLFFFAMPIDFSHCAYFVSHILTVVCRRMCM